MLLEVTGLCVNYGHIEAIRDISFTVPEGTVTTLIGANGAGKTTTLKTVSGLRKVRAGSILFEGKDITSIAPYDRVKLGISQSPEGRRCFVGMTVRENLEMGAFQRTDRANFQEDLDRVFEMFDEKTREGARKNLSGFGDSFAGRGESLRRNQALKPALPVDHHVGPPLPEVDEVFGLAQLSDPGMVERLTRREAIVVHDGVQPAGAGVGELGGDAGGEVADLLVGAGDAGSGGRSVWATRGGPGAGGAGTGAEGRPGARTGRVARARRSGRARADNFPRSVSSRLPRAHTPRRTARRHPCR